MGAAERDRRARMIAQSAPNLESLFLGLDAVLRQAVPYAVAAWATHDPATGLSTSCTVVGLPKDPHREALLYSFEFAEGEPSTYLQLIANGETTAVLSEVTGGDLTRAGRYRQLGADLGVTDELRAVLWDGGRPWGTVTLYRGEGRFTQAEAGRVAELGPQAAAGIRLCLLRAAATRPEAVDEPPGVLEVRPGGVVRSLTAPAARWLEVGGPQLVSAAIIVAAAVRERPGWEGAHSRLPLPDGRVLSLHAASMATDDGGAAVIVDRARPAEVSSLLVDAYGLTARQRQVLGLLLLGRSMSQIARALGVSEHTANDHRKAIYARVGVTSRAELAALLQAEQYAPRAQAGVPPSPYGGFLAG
jgi:DNA-binding CsgD family transcriptional regulator